MNPQVNNLNTTNQTSLTTNNDQVPKDLGFPFELASEHLVKVDEFISDQAKTFDPNVEGYVNYVCEIGGKRIRPALAIITGGSLGEINDEQRVGKYGRYGTGPRKRNIFVCAYVFSFFHIF